jgi:hypothetical protein
MERITNETRCEKCGVILRTLYEKAGVTRTTFHERLKIPLIDTVQNRVVFCCPNCGIDMECVLTIECKRDNSNPSQPRHRHSKKSVFNTAQFRWSSRCILALRG